MPKMLTEAILGVGPCKGNYASVSDGVEFEGMWNVGR